MKNLGTYSDALDLPRKCDVVAAAQWSQITAFATTAESASTITMTSDLTGSIPVGRAIMFKLSGTYYFGQITALTSSLMTIRGATLTTTASALTEIWIGGPQVISVYKFPTVPYRFEDATNAGLLASDCNLEDRWLLAKSYCIGFDFKTKVADGSTQPNVNVKWGGNRISTSNSGAGPASSASWQATGIDIDTTNYVVDLGEAPELECTKNGTGDAEDLNITAIMVTP